MARYEVTMSDGWKVRVNAASVKEAAEKAESLSRYGDRAVSVVPCEDVKLILQ